jgi:Retinal pigment epithelial membrane protein
MGSVRIPVRIICGWWPAIWGGRAGRGGVERPGQFEGHKSVQGHLEREGDGCRVAGTREDDGWLVSIVTHDSENVADLVVIDASDVAAGPVATVHLPRRVPTGFHGAWVPDD